MAIKKTLNLYKPIGATPLSVIKEFKKKKPEYEDVKMAYAGRLDPMAHGVLLILVGEECKNREKYQNLEKKYEFEVLFGVKTDTFDILGMVSSHEQRSPDDTTGIFDTLPCSKEDLLRILKKYNGEIEQEYPPYSSKAVDGKKLFQWSREGKIGEIKIPKKKVLIKKLELVGERELSTKELQKDICNRINLVEGDFRQEEIKESWQTFFKSTERSILKIWKFKTVVSSGAYVRSLADEFGKELGCEAIAFNILRTRVGSYDLES